MDGVGALLELVRRQPGAGCPGCPMGLAPWAVDELLCWEPRAEGGCPRGSGFSEAARWAAGGHGAYAAPREVEGAPRVPGRPQPRGPTLLSGVAPARLLLLRLVCCPDQPHVQRWRSGPVCLSFRFESETVRGLMC